VRDWRDDLKDILSRYLKTPNSTEKNQAQRDDAAVMTALALTSAYYTSQRIITGKMTDSDRTGVADALLALTSGLPLGNPWFMQAQAALVPTMGIVNVGLMHAAHYLAEEKRLGGQTNPATAELRRKAVGELDLLYKIPLLVLMLHRGERVAVDEGVKLRDELEKILVP
jgi:hypothetical protein